jgi:sialic acid synthase SpsE
MPIRIGHTPVGAGNPLFVIAELGLNHGGSVERALALVDAAAAAGASAIKLQTLRGSRLVAPGCPAPMHVQARSLAGFFEQFELDEAAHRAVAARARARGLAVMSTPFDLDAVDLLERVGVDAYKIASGDITFHQLIARAAATGKPLVISTGMSDLSEVASAVTCAREAGAREIALLHCVSAYPVPEGSENLRAIATLASTFDVPVGLSDHTTMLEAAIVATALGASIYERHLVADAEDDAIDRAVSSTPEELRAIIEGSERARRSLGDGVKICLDAEAGNRTASRRGLYAVRTLAPGQVLRVADMVALRPAGAADPRDWRKLTGRRVVKPIAAGDSLDARSFGEDASTGEVRRAV